MDKQHNFPLRLPPELREKLDRQAENEGRSLNNYIVYLLNRSASRKRPAELLSR